MQATKRYESIVQTQSGYIAANKRLDSVYLNFFNMNDNPLLYEINNSTHYLRNTKVKQFPFSVSRSTINNRKTLKLLLETFLQTEELVNYKSIFSQY